MAIWRGLAISGILPRWWTIRRPPHRDKQRWCSRSVTVVGSSYSTTPRWSSRHRKLPRQQIRKALRQLRAPSLRHANKHTNNAFKYGRVDARLKVLQALIHVHADNQQQ